MDHFSVRLTAFVPVPLLRLRDMQVHGSVSERDRILSQPDVIDFSRDIYLTTYDTFQVVPEFEMQSCLRRRVLSTVLLGTQWPIHCTLFSLCNVQGEEAFFTDNALFHTITIDEGASLE